jgi:hypothetical protein
MREIKNGHKDHCPLLIIGSYTTGPAVCNPELEEIARKRGNTRYITMNKSALADGNEKAVERIVSEITGLAYFTASPTTTTTTTSSPSSVPQKMLQKAPPQVSSPPPSPPQLQPQLQPQPQPFFDPFGLLDTTPPSTVPPRLVQYQAPLQYQAPPPAPPQFQAQPYFDPFGLYNTAAPPPPFSTNLTLLQQPFAHDPTPIISPAHKPVVAVRNNATTVTPNKPSPSPRPPSPQPPKVLTEKQEVTKPGMFVDAVLLAKSYFTKPTPTTTATPLSAVAVKNAHANPTATSA